MANLPLQYRWLLNENGPRMINEALNLYDTSEDLSIRNNATIMSWAHEIGGRVEQIYLADSIAWCGLFMAIIAKRAAKTIVTDPLWALNWGTFGNHIADPMLGDVLVFTRKTASGTKAGHVTLYIGEDATCYHCLGGNQKDKVCIIRIQKTRLYTSRRPIYNVQPANVRKVFLFNTGEVSSDEQ
jgi:uncharacterized protein (TIGR02594 family)